MLRIGRSDVRRVRVGILDLSDGITLHTAADHRVHLKERRLFDHVSLESVHIGERTDRLRRYLYGIRLSISGQLSILRNDSTLHGGRDGRMELKERIRWTCPACGRKAIVPSGTNIVCPCSQGTPNTDFHHRTKISKERFNVCKSCRHYGNERCSMIDYGCKATFRILLNDPSGACPLENW